MCTATEGLSLASTGVKLAAVDLNLLVVFDAVMEEGSVTRAGHRLGLSQSAMSHALARLRHLLKDDLFVRSPSGMVPTPRAEQLAAPVRVALDGLRQSLEPTEFDPSTATRTFRVAVDNYAAIVLVAPLATRVIKIAPRVTLEFRPSGTLNISDLLDRASWIWRSAHSPSKPNDFRVNSCCRINSWRCCAGIIRPHIYGNCRSKAFLPYRISKFRQFTMRPISSTRLWRDGTSFVG